MGGEFRVSAILATLDFQFIIKEIIQEHTDGRDSYGKVCGKGLKHPCPLCVCHYFSTSASSTIWKLSESCPFKGKLFFTKMID